jgi:hypothetical protein
MTVHACDMGRHEVSYGLRCMEHPPLASCRTRSKGCRVPQRPCDMGVQAMAHALPIVRHTVTTSCGTDA